MKSFIVLTDLDDLSFAVTNKLPFAIPLSGPQADAFQKAIVEIRRDGFECNGGAFIEIGNGLFQIFYQ